MFAVVMSYGDQCDCRSQIISSLIFHQNRCQRALTEQIRPHDGRGRDHRGLLMNMETRSSADTPTSGELVDPALANSQSVSSVLGCRMATV